MVEIEERRLSLLRIVRQSGDTKGSEADGNDGWEHEGSMPTYRKSGESMLCTCAMYVSDICMSSDIVYYALALPLLFWLKGCGLYLG